MKKQISIQVHDYDRIGRYHIIDERKATREDVVELKRKARASVKVDWDSLDPRLTHIVYYAELVDKRDKVWYAAIYMHGEAYDDDTFYRIFHRPDIGYVGAIHKRV